MLQKNNPENKFFFVYVLLSLRDNKLYIGSTENLEQRYYQHQHGSNASTRSRRPLKLIYFEGHLSEADAKRRESYFKTTKGKVTLKNVLKKSFLESFR